MCAVLYIGPCGVLVPTGMVHSNNEFEFEFDIRNAKPYDGHKIKTLQGLLHRILSDSELRD